MGKAAKVDLNICSIHLQGEHYEKENSNINVFNPSEIFAHIEAEYQNEFTLKLNKNLAKNMAYQLIFQSNVNENKRLTVNIDRSQKQSRVIIFE